MLFSVSNVKAVELSLSGPKNKLDYFGFVSSMCKLLFLTLPIVVSHKGYLVRENPSYPSVTRLLNECFF
jgi:hypothetical protein